MGGIPLPSYHEAQHALTLHNERCAWKGFDWATTDRLHEKGLICDPVNKSKSLVLTDEGLRRSEELFRRLFTR
ncbi:DUF6429 family protein [Rhizobium leguminosarum]|uniref:DUF6429 family protein n=1 Tax=Rhizobium leguminosarum TaxID=384 RepID=UPI000DD8A224|nr:DUF6429 family protein [Rhizobium leguminosarum]